MEMTRQKLMQLLDELIEECHTRGIEGTIAIYGGTAMVYYVPELRTTQDVDSMFRPFSEIQSSIDRINRRMNGDTEWDWKQKLSSWGIATNIKQKMSEEILYDTVMTACANDPKARYQSATAMKRDLMICMDKICACEKRKDNWEAAKKK